MTDTISAGVQALGLTLPQTAPPAANYVPFVRTGDLVFLAGQIAQFNGERPYLGKVGGELSIEEGVKAAELCALNLLAWMAAIVDDDIARIVRCVRLGGFVNCTPEFTQQPRVVNGASDLIVKILGDRGRHARTAVGTNSLPLGVAVEVDAVFQYPVTWSLETVASLSTVAPAEWDACAGDANPFVSHAFLSALEDSRSVGGRSGWMVHHAVLRDAAGRLSACAPLYAKTHSYGEYVFDHGWAEAFEGIGGRYYPKLLCAVPFSPVPGPRLLVRPDAPEGAREALIAGLVEMTRQSGLSSLHVNFSTGDEWEALGQAGFQQRLGQQFHWENRGYASFDDFLAALSSRKRKQIRRERQEALADGISIRVLSGQEIGRKDWDAFFRFYLSTSDRKWGSAYLTRPFFDLLGERLGDKVVLVMAEKDGRWIGAALNLRGADALYGRNWGCDGDWKFLHFEACYYQAIDYAIRHGLARVEAGAQGTHKIQRGYLPVATFSAHWFADRRLAEGVGRFLEREREAVLRRNEDLEELSPFKETVEL